MISVDAVGSSQQASQQTSSAVSKAADEIGKSQFLELLVAQLQNQDPLDPVDNQQFVAQLATFSSLEQLISINQGVSTLASAVDENTAVTA
jgi:flagellar basal-body rod modification protein FlgD